jgi:hypothetical protein
MQPCCDIPDKASTVVPLQLGLGTSTHRDDVLHSLWLLYGSVLPCQDFYLLSRA